MRVLHSFFLSAVLLGIVASCESKHDGGATGSPSDPEKIRLIKEVAALHDRLENEGKLTETLTTYSESLQRQIDAQSAMIDALKAMNLALETKSALSDSASGTTPPEIQEVPEQKTWETMSASEKLAAYRSSGIDGIPPAEAQKILAKADLESSDFMKLSVLEREAGGFLGVDSFSRSVSAMPTKVRDEILASAKREHPGSWSRMADEVNEQSQAWITLDGWQKQGMPGMNRTETKMVLDAVLARYPSDWKMALFSVDSEAKKLKRK